METPPAARRYRDRVEHALARWLALEQAASKRLAEAMRYGVLGGGKRVRALLCYFTGEALQLPADSLDAPACAVEIIHAYSLIHDDLPAMDDDDLRRGKPSCHRAFDEATAILAGDALQVLAFEVLTTDPALARAVPAEARLTMIRELALASGPQGMAGGQAVDLESQGLQLDLPALAAMHARKTGALIRASVLMVAAMANDLPAPVRAALDRYATALGLAFQIHDDVLDVTGDSTLIGKRAGADAARNKATYPAVLGLDGARAEAARLADEAVAALQPLGSAAAPLGELARYITGRDR